MCGDDEHRKALDLEASFRRAEVQGGCRWMWTVEQNAHHKAPFGQMITDSTAFTEIAENTHSHSYIYHDLLQTNGKQTGNSFVLS
jgi:hypothetical protein